MSIFNLPDLGEGLPDAEIREWYVKEGDVVKVDQPLVSMETAKAVVDVPSPQDGKIVKLYGKEGDVITTGAAFIEFESDEATEPKSAATVAGKIEVGNKVLHESATGVTPSKSKSTSNALPAVRMLAKKLNVNLDSIKGTGPNGRITADDVKSAAEQPNKAPQGYEPLRGVRRNMSIAMSQSHAEVVSVTIVDDADIHGWGKGTDITIRIIRALQAACETETVFNAWFDGKSQSLKQFKEIKLGIAMDSGEGLFVPVIKDIANQDDAAIRAIIERYKKEVTTREIPQEDLRDNTIVLSNFGSFAGRYATPIVVPPTVAIIGTGKIREEVVAVEGKAEVHKVLPLSLTFDHRAATGGEAARFLRAMLDALK